MIGKYFGLADVCALARARGDFKKGQKPKASGADQKGHPRYSQMPVQIREGRKLHRCSSILLTNQRAQKPAYTGG